MNRKGVLIVSALICLFSGCSGSSIMPLELGDIQGPKVVNERTSTQYSVDVTGNEDPTFEWTIEPDTVGALTNEKTQKPTLHTYELVEDIDAKLTLIVETTKLGTVVQSIDIKIVDSNQPPSAQASVDHEKIGDGQYVQFTDESVDPNNDINNWEWDFSYEVTTGFQPENIEQNPSEQFPDAGMFDVQFRVTDSMGHMDMLDEPITIEVVINTPPIGAVISRLSTTSEIGNPDETVKQWPAFYDYEPPDDSWEYLWECSDGFFDDPTAMYPIWTPPGYPAECEISVRITDWFGLSAIATSRQWATSLPKIKNDGNNTNVPSVAMERAFYPPSETLNLLHLTADYDYPPDGNVVLVGFWASWSSASIVDMPALTSIYYQFFDDDYVQVHVNLGETRQDVIDFVNLNPYVATYWCLDPDAYIFGLFDHWFDLAGSIPIYLLFDRDGRCRWIHAGSLDSTASLQSVIEELL